MSWTFQDKNCMEGKGNHFVSPIVEDLCWLITIERYISLMGNVCSPRLGGKDFEIPDLRAKNRYGNTEQIYDDSLVRTVFPISHEENKNSRVLEQIQ